VREIGQQFDLIVVVAQDPTLERIVVVRSGQARIGVGGALFLAATPTPPMDLDERIIEADLDANLVDLRELPMSDPIYDSTDYTASQAQARGARTAGADGIAYCSIRRPGGACVAVFRPRLVRNAITAGFIGLRWDGAKIIDAFRKASLTTTYP